MRNNAAILGMILLGMSVLATRASACPGLDDLEYLGAAPLGDCVELARFDIATGQGPVSAGVFGPADANLVRVAAIEAGLIRAGNTLEGLGALGSDPVAVYLSSDDINPALDLGTPEAITARGLRDHICNIAAFPMALNADISYVLAHEFFHCVQNFNFAEQNRSAGAKWWAEGSAEWFASLAYPGSDKSDGLTAMFDATSPETPLTSMEDDSVVFFWWYSQQHGAGAVIGLIGAMPTGGGAQNDALARVLDEAAFLQFSKDYTDRKINQPGGGAIASNPFIGDYYEISHNQEIELSAERFVLFRVRIKFECGVWTLEESELSGRYQMQRHPGETWETIPPEVRADSEGDFEYSLVDGATGPQGFRVSIDIKKEPCSQCVAVNYSDGPAACLVGEWHLTGGGYGAQIGKALARVPSMQNIDYPDIDGFLTLNRDGTFTLGADDAGHMEVISPSGKVSRADVQFNFEQHGTWSINGNKLEQCYVRTRDINIDFQLTSPSGGRDRVIMDEYLGPKISRTTKRRFACTPGQLKINEGGFLGPKVQWIYAK